MQQELSLGSCVSWFVCIYASNEQHFNVTGSVWILVRFHAPTIQWLNQMQSTLCNFIQTHTHTHTHTKYKVCFNSNKSTNQMQQCLKFITWCYIQLNMFRASPRPSSGAQQLQPLVLPSECGVSSAVGRGRANHKIVLHCLLIDLIHPIM